MTQEELEKIRSMIAEGFFPQAIFDRIRELSGGFTDRPTFSDTDLIQAITNAWRDAGESLDGMWTLRKTREGARDVAEAKATEAWPLTGTVGIVEKPLGVDLDEMPSRQDVYRQIVTSGFNTPLMGRAAQRLFPMVEQQYALQQPLGTEGFVGGPFAEFLRHGTALRGGGLSARLDELAEALRMAEANELPLGEGYERQKAFAETFIEPQRAFEAFAQAGQQRTGPAFREALWRAQQRTFDRWTQMNPRAPSSAVAGLFNR